MRALALVLLAAAAQSSLAQDLLVDFQRLTIPTVRTTEYEGIPPFQIGFIDVKEQHLFQYPVRPYRANLDKLTPANPDIFGASSPAFASAIWWNLGPADFALPDNRLLPAQSVMMFSSDRIPTIRFDVPTPPTIAFQKIVSVRVTVAPGQSTPGTLIFQRYVRGQWETFFDFDLSSTPGRFFSASFRSTSSDATRNRLILVRNGAGPARAKVSLEIYAG